MLGAPIHKSATCVVKRGYDMRAEDEYREQFQSFAKKYSSSAISKSDFRAVLSKLGLAFDDGTFEEKFTNEWDMDASGAITENEFVKFCVTEVDKNQKREVVFKFMKKEDQFKRELEARDESELDPRYVVNVTKSFNGDTFRAALSSIPELVEYKYAVLMPSADRNLDTIFRSERPDINKIRALVSDVAKAVEHLHSKELLHGDLKFLNTVRIDERLCLIDLDASVFIGDTDPDAEFKSYAGAKFSSGVLPPEMIHKLRGEGNTMFGAYFESVTSSDPELWNKIKPKRKGRRGAYYVVKTFRTVRDADGFEQPELPEGLPYDLVEATPAIDIWSFGTILYALITGSPLFPVNRDDDLDSGEAMAALHDWDENSLADKLSTVENPPVKDLLFRLLARDPAKRPKDMKEVLAHDFFVERAASHSQVKEILASTRRLEMSTAQIIKMSATTQALVEKSTSKLCKAIFEATEVSTPTRMVILPYALPPPEGEVSEEEQQAMLDQAESWIGTVTGLVEEGQGMIENPASYAKSFFGSVFKNKVEEVKESLCEKHLYLYLVDEFTNKPVYDESGVYPIKIETRSELVDKYMPMMRVGLQTAAVVNGALSLANLFCPAVPSRLVPKSMIDKAQGFVDGLDKGSNVAESSSVQKHVDSGDGGGGAKRGEELRDFEKFLLKHDPESSFAGLSRVCNEENGDAIWVTEDSTRMIELQSNDGSYLALEKEIERKDNLVKERDATIDNLLKQIEGLMKQESNEGNGGKRGRRIHPV
jgi:serine/threonine protein kinase